eukprot:TRINITY_DN12934_c0_g3_i2.p2 TRINITY_DN12934_c0_g3~~TRINITY_DN12934_c0_g3_i2.p2  ORF type:complete len:396 (+),score=80.72 TRINITY_DN12934_c0_g3_i2:928-2115(+)
MGNTVPVGELKTRAEIRETMVDAIKQNDTERLEELFAVRHWRVPIGGGRTEEVRPVDILLQQRPFNADASTSPSSPPPLDIAFKDTNVQLETVKFLLKQLRNGHPKLDLILCYHCFKDVPFLRWLIAEKEAPIPQHVKEDLCDPSDFEFFKFVLEEMDHDLNRISKFGHNRRKIDHLCLSHQSEDVRWLDVVAQHFSLGEANIFTKLTPLEYAIIGGNVPVVRYLIDVQKIEVSQRANYLLSTDAWHVYPKFHKNLLERNYQTCIELVQAAPGLGEYVVIEESQDNILFDSLWNSKKLVHMLMEMDVPFCYPQNVWSTIANYPDPTLRFEALKKRQNDLFKMTIVKCLTTVKTRDPVYMVLSLDLFRVFFSMLIESAECSLEMRFSPFMTRCSRH